MITTPVLYAINLLEDAILTLDPDGAVANKPVDRIADRDIGLENEDSGTTGDRIWHADLGAGTLPAVTTFIFAGSNYAGELVTLESSPDDTVWTTQGTITPADNDPQRITFGSLTAPRYWRMVITDPALPIIITEAFLTVGVSLTFKPTARNLREPRLPNVVVVETASGRAWGVKRGARRWTSKYVMTYAPDTDRITIDALLDAIDDGAKPFWLLDVTGELRWVRMGGGVDFTAADMTLSFWDIELNFVEELP